MLKRKYIALFFMAMVAVFTLFAATQVMADCPVPTSCTLVDQSGNPTPYSITTAPDPATGQWPIPVTDSNNQTSYKWMYTINGGIGTVNQANTLVPVCCPTELGATVGPSNGGQVLGAGVGDSTTNFGVGIFQDYVVRMAQSSPTVTYYLTAQLGPVQNTSIQVKVGKALYWCKNIAGPACPPADFIPINTTEEKQFGIFDVKVTRDVSWCAKTIKYFDPRPLLDDGTPNPNYNQWVISVPENASIDGHSIISCGPSDGNQRCQECVVFAHSTGCYTISSGGTTYKIPTGCK